MTMNTTFRLSVICLVGATSSLMVAAPASSSAPALVAQWNFDTLTGDTVVGSGPTAKPGKITGTVNLVNGRKGSKGMALEFPSTGIAQLTTPLDLSVIAVNGAFSVELWARPDSSNPTGYGTIFDSGGRNALGIRTSGSMRITAITGGVWNALVTPEKFIPGEWVHIVAACDGKTTRLYLNGTEAASQTLAPVRFGPSIQIGSVTESTKGDDGYTKEQLVKPFLGAIDDLKIYNYALTPAAVKAAASGGK